MFKWGQFRAFYRKLCICMPANVVCICFSEVKKDISRKQRFYRLFDTNFGKNFYSMIFFVLRLHLDRNDSKIVFSIMIL